MPALEFSESDYYSSLDDIATGVFDSQFPFQDCSYLPRSFPASTIMLEDPSGPSILQIPSTSVVGDSAFEPHYSWSTDTSMADSGDSASSTLDTNPTIYSRPSESVETSSPVGESSIYETVSCLNFEGRSILKSCKFGLANERQMTHCDVEGCSASFRRPTDLNRHKNTIHNSNATRHVCGCCVGGTKRAEFVRKDKVKPHKINKHGCHKSSSLVPCNDQDVHKNQVFWFCSKANLQAHLRSIHGYSIPETQLRTMGTDQSENANGQSVQFVPSTG